jgi:hypothetical protein
MYFNKESGENREEEKDPLTQQVIGCAIEVHRTPGPGLVESTYENASRMNLNLLACLLSIRRQFQSIAKA